MFVDVFRDPMHHGVVGVFLVCVCRGCLILLCIDLFCLACSCGLGLVFVCFVLCVCVVCLFVRFFVGMLWLFACLLCSSFLLGCVCRVLCVCLCAYFLV